MRYFLLLSVSSLCTMLSGCDTGLTACPHRARGLTASVINGTGQPLVALSVTDTVPRTGAVPGRVDRLAS